MDMNNNQVATYYGTIIQKIHDHQLYMINLLCLIRHPPSKNYSPRWNCTFCRGQKECSRRCNSLSKTIPSIHYHNLPVTTIPNTFKSFPCRRHLSGNFSGKALTKSPQRMKNLGFGFIEFIWVMMRFNRRSSSSQPEQDIDSRVGKGVKPYETIYRIPQISKRRLHSKRKD